MAGIAVFEVVDLVQLELVLLRGIERNTVIDGKRNVSSLEERDQVIEVFLGSAARRNDRRSLRGGDLLEKHPVVHV